MRHFTLKQLRYFTVAGELSSVTLAARKLHVSQPSITAAIRQMEESSGLQLFVRHHAQGLSLTSSGRQLWARTRQLLRDADDLERFTLSLGEEIAGELRLVAFPTFAPVFLPQLLRRYTETYGSVSLHCDEMIQGDIVTGLSEGVYELAFTYDLQIPANIEFTPLYSFPPYAVVAEGHPLGQRKRISLRELIDYPMVLLDWPQSREYFLSIFESRKLTPRVAYRARSLDMIRGLVASGFGFSLFNTPLTSRETFDGGRLRALWLQDDAQPLSMGIACVKGVRPSPAAQAMKQLALQTELPAAALDDSEAVRTPSQ
ncbi:LysR family transcriptional regulator [Kushneria aurantia]|uniref:LysR family transcriptional regulator n=1 Tax=Kushneria aurantia TaxID=504092 RepID=A0ABV6FZV8_9GAMM|nr:LysR family transcriptional regulator [Kushneria aurantia]